MKKWYITGGRTEEFDGAIGRRDDVNVPPLLGYGDNRLDALISTGLTVWSQEEWETKSVSKGTGWIGVDLDSTLAYYDSWRGETHIGAPIPLMIARVKAWIAAGIDVRIVTARVSCSDVHELAAVTAAVHAWCREHIGVELPLTCTKDYQMIELWDDRCVQVEKNTGRRVDGGE